MGVDFTSESGDSTRFGYGGWSYVLEIAKRYGWQPQGTERPSSLDTSESWAGGYESSDGQRVTAADARALAVALESALEDPELRASVMEMDAEDRRRVEQRLGPVVAAAYVGVRDFEEYRRVLREFVAFCRRGSFVIE